MSYRTILVHVDDSGRAGERIKIAANIALAENAHLIGVATTGISTALYPSGIIDPGSVDVTPFLDLLRKQADQALEDFEATVRRIGLPSFERRLEEDEAGGGISLQARYCDLVVIGQSDPNESTSVIARDFPEFVVMNSAHPVLIVPYAGQFDSVGKRPLVAWDASVAASHAITDAIPFLRQADAVEVAIFSQENKPGAFGDEPGADIALYLARHGVKVNVRHQTTGMPVGNALLLLATELASDLIVMGGYGHARFREILLGGVTRTILESTFLPVLMSH